MADDADEWLPDLRRASPAEAQTILLAVSGELERAGLLLGAEFDRRYPDGREFISNVGLVDYRLEVIRHVMDKIEREQQMRNPMPIRPLPGQTTAPGWYLLARRSFRNGEHVIKQGERVPLSEAKLWRNYRALISSMTLSLEPEKEKPNGKAAHVDR